MKIIHEEHQHKEDHQHENDDARTTSSLPDSSSTAAAAAADRKEEMLWMARRLRRAKRSLLLKSVEAPSSPVDKFRSIVMNLSSQQGNDSMPTMTSSRHHHLPYLPFKPINATSSSRSAADNKA
jgi:hypothetical protein